MPHPPKELADVVSAYGQMEVRTEWQILRKADAPAPRLLLADNGTSASERARQVKGTTAPEVPSSTIVLAWKA